MAWDADFEAKIGSLTPDQIVVALRPRLDPARITIVKAGDFIKKVSPMLRSGQ